MKRLALILLLLASPAWATDYYVDGAVGNDLNAGTSEGAGNAWATIDNAMNTVSAGDLVYVKASADYTELSTLDTVGTAAAAIVFEGYTTTPGDGGMVTVDATGLNNGFDASTTFMYYKFRNFTVENSNFEGWNFPSKYRIHFENCHALNCGTHGFEFGGDAIFIDCTATGCGNDGFTVAAKNTFYGCTATGNSSDGFYCSSYSNTFINCVSASNADTGFTLSESCQTINCTVDGDNDDTTVGIDLSGGDSERGMAVINTIVYDCATGISGDATPFEGGQIGRNNLLYANTTDYSNWPSSEQATDVAGDPAFTDEANGDYSLGSGSAALNAGWDYSGTSSPGMDIGAYQMEDAGSGSGRIIITG